MSSVGPRGAVHPMSRPIAGLVGWVCVVAVVAAVGAFASLDADLFYCALSRPAWAPAASLFGPVWTVLYLLMAIAAWRVWLRAGFAEARLELSLFLAQLVLNGAWTWLFFSLHKGLWAFTEIVILWVCIAAVTALFARRDRLAGALLLPYLAWVTFAAFLNFSLWQRNPSILS